MYVVITFKDFVHDQTFKNRYKVPILKFSFLKKKMTTN